LEERQLAKPPIATHKTGWVSHRLGNSQPFFRQGTTLSKRAQFSMAPGEKGGSVHSGKDKLTEALAASCPVEERHSLLEASDRLTIVTLGLVSIAEGLIRQCV
jgi:hypothetical protein